MRLTGGQLHSAAWMHSFNQGLRLVGLSRTGIVIWDSRVLFSIHPGLSIRGHGLNFPFSGPSCPLSSSSLAIQYDGERTAQSEDREELLRTPEKGFLQGRECTSR